MRRLPLAKTASFLCLLAACGGGEIAPAPGPAATATAPPGTPPPSDAGTTIEPDATISPADAGADAPTGPVTAKECFKDLTGPVVGPDYDQYKPVILPSCAGTHHQTITGVEKVVFLGDSITAGTPPTPIAQFYRSQLVASLTQKYGALEVGDCSAWGARMDDLLQGKGELAKCFPAAVEPKRTLIVMTNGGNDIASWAKDGLDAGTATTAADAAVGLLRDAIGWLKDPVRFPNGSFITFTNAYEYTDTSGDLSSCPASSLVGMPKSWPQGTPSVVYFQEQMMKVAVETKTDMVFLLEHFCGHGYKKDDATLQCYRGPNTEQWFDLTCIHPTPTGHGEIAKLFQQVIDG